MSVARQCRALGIGRRSAYDAPRPVPQRDLDLMRAIGEIHTAEPTFGARQIVGALAHEGIRAGRNRVGRLMRVMSISALAPKPMTSVKAKGHKVFPYLLSGLRITEPNHVWCSDITYIRLDRGFLYLVAVMDWATRYVLSWRLSNSMKTRFYMDALDEALRGRPAPRILNTDQGSQSQRTRLRHAGHGLPRLAVAGDQGRLTMNRTSPTIHNHAQEEPTLNRA